MSLRPVAIAQELAGLKGLYAVIDDPGYATALIVPLSFAHRRVIDREHLYNPERFELHAARAADERVPVARAELEGERITFELECGHVVGLALADAGDLENLPTALLCPACSLADVAPTQQPESDCQPEHVREGDPEAATDRCFLCLKCGTVTLEDSWTYWQPDPEHKHGEADYRPHGLEEGDDDAFMRCPRCGEMNGEPYVGAGLEEGTRAQCEAERAKLLADGRFDEAEWAEALPAPEPTHGGEER